MNNSPSRGAFTACLALLVGCLLGGGGCAFSRNYTPTPCSPADLSPADLDEFLSSAPPRFRQGNGGVIGDKFLWVPLVTKLQCFHNLLRGSSPHSLPPLRDIGAEEPWGNVNQWRSFGPFSCIWLQLRSAHFNLAGKNLGYHRDSYVLWGFLWQDFLSRPGGESNVEEYCSAGPLFGGFGYANKRDSAGESSYLRLFWIPIGVGWQPRREPTVAAEAAPQ